jgi:hypothetical protein
MRSFAVVLAVLGLVLAGCGPSPVPRSQAPSLPAALAASLPTQAEPSRRSPIYNVVFYLPNRIVDLLDCVSFGVGIPSVPFLFPSSVHANAHVTRAFQAGAGTTHGLFLGKDYSREFAWALIHNELAIGPLTVAELKHTTRESASVERVGILLPSDEPFAKKHMDYWAIGAHAGMLPVAVSADVHPVEIVDALLGFLFIDILDDDYMRAETVPTPTPPPPAPAPATVPAPAPAPAPTPR